MKHVYTFCGAALAVALAACAGTSSNNNSSNSGGNNTQAGLVRIEATLKPTDVIAPIDQTGPAGCPINFTLIDPTQIEAGDSWEFQLASYDANNNRTVLNASGWLTTDTSNTYGSVSYDKGVLTTYAQTRTPETVSVVYNGVTYRQEYDIQAHRARVRGQVLAHDTGAAIGGLEIDFYGPNSITDNSVVFRGKVVTQSDGTFLASVPAQLQVPDGSGGTLTFNPTQFFQINDASIPAGYQKYFEYNSNIYQTGLITCLAPAQVPGTGVPMPLVNGNNDLISKTQCSNVASIEPTNGWILLYSNKEATPTTTGCSG